MRMVNDHAEVIKSSSSLETSQASITMTPEMFSLLSSGVYTFKERAVIRELSCNAVDTHKEAGKEDVPFRVHLPTRFDPYFEVRDFGTGLTHEKVMSLYLNYGASTKNDSNDYIGAMGIGSKSPFAIAQSFTVSSYVDGVVNKYSVYLENGIPQVTKLTTNQTTEPNGLAVRVAVADHRIQKFHEEASNVFSYFKLKPECNVEYRDILSEMTTIVREDGVYDAMKYKENWRSSNNQTNFNVVMGNIAYPVDLGDLLGAEFTNVLPTFFRNAVDLVNIYMPIGSVAIAASREALQMNETTKKAITDAVKKITATIVEDVVKRIADEPTLVDAAQAYADLRANSREIFQHVFTRLEWNGQNLSNLEQKLLKIRQGQLSNQDGTPKFATDDSGALVVDKSGNHIPVIGNLYEPVAYFKYSQLENKIRATSALYTQEGANFSIFGAMSKNKMINYLFLINDRRNKNGTEKTVGRNQIIRGACRDRENEDSNFRRYNGIVYVFSDEKELDDFISLHMLDKSLLTIVKMSDKEHHYVKRTVTRGVVKLYKASVHEHGVSYTEVKENFDDIEEPQYYIKAQSDEVLGGIFNCSPEGAAKVMARLTGQSVYVFRKANWKKIPEDWLEVNQQVFKDSITDIHWIEFNRFVTREWCSSNCDITDKGVIARTFQFGDKKCSRGYVYSTDYSKRIFLEGNEDAVERHEATLKGAKKAASKPAKQTLKQIAKSAKKTATKPVAKAVKEAVKKEPVNQLHEAMQNGNQIEYMITGDSVIMTFGADSEIVESTHPNYKEIVMAVVGGEYKKAFELMNIRKSIENFTQGAITIKGDNLYYGAVQMRSTLVDRILDMMKVGDDGFKRLVAFFEKLMENPSKDSVEQLWGFVSHLDVEIDEEGYIIGWKKVTTRGGKLFDSRTCKVPNDLGNVVEMPRWMVDNDRTVTCSQGLHVGAWDYVRSFSGDTILKVRVHPRDVVSVPTDYQDMKMRASRYEVAAIVNGQRQVVKEWDGKSEALHVVVGTAGELISQRKREI